MTPITPLEVGLSVDAAHADSHATVRGERRSLSPRSSRRVLEAATPLLGLADDAGFKGTALRWAPASRTLSLTDSFGLDRHLPWAGLGAESQRMVIGTLESVLAELGVEIANLGAPLSAEAAFWRARYQANETAWDLGEAAPPLMRLARTLPRGRALVVGCGTGHEVLELARMGFEVVGLDIAPEAVALTRERCVGTSGTAVEGDVFALPGALGPFDLWVEHTCFCAIDPARRDDYVAAAAATVKPEGTLLGLFYAHGRAGGPPFTTDAAEVRRRFDSAFSVEELEVAPDSHPRRKGEELLGRFTRR